MNRAILTGSEAISAHYYTTMCIVQYGHVTTGGLHGNGGWHAPPGVTSERRLARSTRRYIGTALRGVSVLTFLYVVCCLYVTFLLPLQPHTIGQNWSGPIKLGPTCIYN